MRCDEKIESGIGIGSKSNAACPDSRARTILNGIGAAAPRRFDCVGISQVR